MKTLESGDNYLDRWNIYSTLYSDSLNEICGSAHEIKKNIQLCLQYSTIIIVGKSREMVG